MKNKNVIAFFLRIHTGILYSQHVHFFAISYINKIIIFLHIWVLNSILSYCINQGIFNILYSSLLYSGTQSYQQVF